MEFSCKGPVDGGILSIHYAGLRGYALAHTSCIAGGFDLGSDASFS